MNSVKPMNCIVCVKKIQDPEIPPAKFRLDDTSKRVLPPEGIPPVMNPYDAQAVELALRLKEKHGGKVVVLSVEPEADPIIIKHALSMGADDGVLLADRAFEGSDSYAVAHIISRAIKKFANPDLVLCGRQAADWDEGLVGTFIAAELDLPLVTLAKEAKKDEDSLRIKRVTLDGYQVFAVRPPAVVTVSSEAEPPRLPSGWGIISAARARIPVWDAKQIRADPSRIGPQATRKTLTKLSVPERQRRCELIEGKTPAEAAARLADLLMRAGVV